jgi:hypothetical protein
MTGRLALLVPMRAQPIRRELFWYTFARTRRGPTPIQLIIRVDDDDEDTAAWVRENTDATLLVGPRYDGYRSLPRYFNEMVRHVTPDTTAIMCGNDDMRFETVGWADRVCRATRRYPSFFNIGVMTFPAGAFPFSCVSPKMVDVLGRLNREDLIYSDIYLRDVHARLGVCELVPSVEILHIGQASANAIGVKETVDRAYWLHHAACVAEDVETLRPRMTRRAWGWRVAASMGAA